MARFDVAGSEQGENGGLGGAPDPLFELGLKFCTGRDVELDLVAAHKWFNLAALKGNEDAKRYRMELATEMSRNEIAAAQRQAREWLSQN